MLCYSLSHGALPMRGGVSVSACLRVWSALIPTPPPCPDVYQDLFEEGSYTGKGIYAVDALKLPWLARRPTRRSQSRPLSRACSAVWARLGRRIVEAYPARYDVAALRYQPWALETGNCCRGFSGGTSFSRRSEAIRMMPASADENGRQSSADISPIPVCPLSCRLALTFDAAVIWTSFCPGYDRMPVLHRCWPHTLSRAMRA